MRLASAFVVWVVLALLVASRGARADGSPLAAAIATARAKSLAASPGWRRLLVMAEDDATSSQVDGDAFFLAPLGRTDPEAELVATLGAFFAPAAAGREDAHALCRFPARARFLDAALGFSKHLVAPPPRCPALERFDAEVEAQSVALVYAANDVASPPSAFGHIFLRLRTRAPRHATDETDTADHGVDYTATTDTRNPVVYAIKGVGGLFAGRVRVTSYDAMLREYATVASRDVWEYDLALRPDEVRLLLAHLWELSNARIDYGYTGENCAYRLVAAIDAAAPRLHLVDALGWAAMPIDAAKAVERTPGLVRGVAYRPSVRSAARIALAPLDEAQRAAVDRLLEDPGAPLPPPWEGARAVDVLDAAMRVLEARRTRGMLDGRDEDAIAMKDQLSARRDAIAVGAASRGEPTTVRRPADRAPPDRVHGPVRLALGSGVTSQYVSGFATVGGRLALHDLADPPDGAPELAQVQLLDTKLRLDLRRRELTVDSLTFAELSTLAPLTRWDERPSWRARAFGVRLHDDGCPDCFAHGLDGSVGLATGFDDDRLVLFLLADAFVAFAPDVQGGLGDSFIRLGVGPWAGARFRIAPTAVALVGGTWSWLPAQAPEQTFDVRATVRAGLAEDVALGVELAAQPRSAEAQLLTYLYF